ncbi:hypothetical protein E1263_34505 [Kribbella antibiotica]|uniref:Uncharacterized protein n=1 Tax=Kribbella antibiotica TaxID=190195 RepID=A0A4R4YS61_9ACTN|nr:hypothetical protein [Kribbella antibiotica]TDD47480.1 hypothetical protein E1263_34505 [Kribbella antibiotica]
MARSELSGRADDPEPAKPMVSDTPEVVESAPPTPPDKVERPDPFPELTDRYSLKVRQLMAADDRFTRLGPLPQDSQDSTPERPKATQDNEPRAADPAPSPDRSDNLPEPFPELADRFSLKLRQQMATDDRFTRLGPLPQDSQAPDRPEPPKATRDDEPRAADPTPQPDRSDSLPERPKDSGSTPPEPETSDSREQSGEPKVSPSAADEPNPLDSTGDQVERTHEFIEDAEPDEMAQYRRIRVADDIDAIVTNCEYPREIIEEAKDNLFLRQHDVAVAPGQIRHGYFTPAREIGDLWELAASGADMDAEQTAMFRSLLAHEYVESKLMDAGLPYLSDDPGAFTADGVTRVTAEYRSAHLVAPLSMQPERIDLLRLWDGKLELPRNGLRVAEDLSNLDEVVRVAKEGLGL